MCSHAVAVIVIKDGKFLMVKNPKRGWEFPGGCVEYGEDIYEAAKRECREEAGVEIDNLTLLGNENGTFFILAEMKSISGEGEFERKFFSSLPDNLSFPREEVKKYLEIARKGKL